MAPTVQLTPEEALSRPDLWLASEAPFIPWHKGVELLALYMDMLLKWNRALNLSGCHAALPLLRTLVQDSFFLAQFLNGLGLATDCRVLDLGAGAGLPGIPLRIFWPQGEYIMVERNQKRVLFLQNVLALLKLPRTRAHAGDAEECLRMDPGDVPAIVSRAFKPWKEVLALCAPTLIPGGLVIVMASDPPPGIMPAPWHVTRHTSYELPAGKMRWLWAVAKGEIFP